MSETTRTKTGLLGPILCYGFAITVAMWLIGYATHHPVVKVPPMTSGILLIFTLLAGSIFAGGTVERRQAVKVGLGVGFVAAALNLLILGSYLAQNDSTTAAKVPLALEMGGFVLLGVAIGGIGGLLGTVIESIFSARRKELIIAAEEPDWLARFGVVAVAAAFPLLILGGLTTSSGSGLSVPDWPATYGSNMFLYPIGLMTRPRVFIEHSHRLFGALVGITTIALVFFTFIGGERRRGMRIGVVMLLLLVIAQGIMGGIRVTAQNTFLAFAHGVVAQLFFAGLVAYAACLSPMFKNTNLPRGTVMARRPKIMATAFLHTTILQLIFGAMYRHYGSPHALYSHIGLSIFVVLTALFTSMEVRTMLQSQIDPKWAWPQRAMKMVGTAILTCVSLQFLLGWLAFYIVAGVKVGKPLNPVGDSAVLSGEKPWPEQLIPTLHQANGALLLAFATLAYVWVMRLWKRASVAPAPTV